MIFLLSVQRLAAISSLETAMSRTSTHHPIPLQVQVRKLIKNSFSTMQELLVQAAPDVEINQTNVGYSAKLGPLYTGYATALLGAYAGPIGAYSSLKPYSGMLPDAP